MCSYLNFAGSMTSEEAVYVKVIMFIIHINYFIFVANVK